MCSVYFVLLGWSIVDPLCKPRRRGASVSHRKDLPYRALGTPSLQHSTLQPDSLREYKRLLKTVNRRIIAILKFPKTGDMV